jgi:hypothetical protein
VGFFVVQIRRKKERGKKEGGMVVNRAERRNQKKSEKWQETSASGVLRASKQVAGQARARTERGLVRHVAQEKGRRS